MSKLKDYPVPYDEYDYIICRNGKEYAEAVFHRSDDPQLFYKLSAEHQSLLLEWCHNLKKLKNISTRITSYGLKHLFSDLHNGLYISNGQMKGAMALAGFRVDDENDLNWCFNLSSKDISILYGAVNKCPGSVKKAIKAGLMQQDLR